MKILIVDDSALMRRKLAQIFQSSGDFQLELARNGVEAIELNKTFEPDVITLDINMPQMDGLTALSQIMLDRPVPVVMVSSLTAAGALATFEALALGAVDYVAKPGGTISLSIDEIERDIIKKVRQAAKAKIRRTTNDAATRSDPENINSQAQKETLETKEFEKAPARSSRSSEEEQELTGLVLVGVSTGGPGTLESLLPKLPEDFPYPVVVAQHMPAAFTGAFAQRMDGLSRLKVVEVCKLTLIETGYVYIAKGGADITFVNRSDKLYLMPKTANEKFAWHPSVELMARSALEVCEASALIGVMLTGMGDDGADAFTQIKKQGGRTIAESEESAVLYGMPKELIERRGASLVLPIEKMAGQLVHWAK